MSKILLVYDDYAELMNVESALKKVGFDVIGVTHELSLADQVISFNPDIVIGSGRGAKVSSLGVGRRLKEMTRWSGKAVLIFPSNARPSGSDLIKIRSDIILEAPVPPLRLIQVLAKILDLDEAVLLERLNKMIHSEPGGAAPANTFSTSSPTGKGENVRFIVGGGAPEKTGATMVTGSGFNRAPEHPEEEQEKGSSKKGSLFTHLKGREDLYREEVKGGVQEENLFPEVDLKSLEAEFNPSANPNSAPTPDSVPTQISEVKSVDEAREGAPSSVQISQQEELAQAQGTLKERIARYAKYLEEAPPEPGQLTRIEARKRQRELVKEWDGEKLKDLDKLRREFAKALYKK